MSTDGLKVWLLSYRGVVNGRVAKNKVTQITSNRHLFCLVLVIAVIFAIAAWACYSQARETVGSLDMSCSVIGGENILKAVSFIDRASALREVCVVFFLLATVLLAVQAIFLLYAGRLELGGSPSPPCDLQFADGSALRSSVQDISVPRCLTQNTCPP